MKQLQILFWILITTKVLKFLMITKYILKNYKMFYRFQKANICISWSSQNFCFRKENYCWNKSFLNKLVLVLGRFLPMNISSVFNFSMILTKLFFPTISTNVHFLLEAHKTVARNHSFGEGGSQVFVFIC